MRRDGERARDEGDGVVRVGRTAGKDGVGPDRAGGCGWSVQYHRAVEVGLAVAIDETSVTGGEIWQGVP